MKIAPSLLAADFGHLTREVRRVDQSGADWLHLDIMDGHFVPNISFGPAVVKTVRPLSSLFFDVHLMCARPEILLEPFAQAGADQLNIHVELKDQVSDLIWRIRSLNKKVGLAINPPTPLPCAEPFLDKVDSLLIMTVNPGFGGQVFIEEMLTKVERAAEWRRARGLRYHIGVDGGIDVQTAAQCAHAGADCFISGTALFKLPGMKRGIKRMRAAIEKSNPAAATLDPDDKASSNGGPR